MLYKGYPRAFARGFFIFALFLGYKSFLRHSKATGKTS
ncbi:hypothetical protein CLOLEP_02712 [[Clostridium] leptum DSM 753]|uniref:Uncharacterized protein n=1 Tax=[Clostridium] leptum DSM 753 TaxID=428125 RepID=A7VVU9_9FIRM|nr:hypothetical protein CLOLEP_02712 [[Clostridium] leptum DSM 753]